METKIEDKKSENLIEIMSVVIEVVNFFMTFKQQAGHSAGKSGKPENVRKFQRTWKSHGFFRRQGKI